MEWKAWMVKMKKETLSEILTHMMNTGTISVIQSYKNFDEEGNYIGPEKMDPGYDSCYGIEKNSYKRDYLVFKTKWCVS